MTQVDLGLPEATSDRASRLARETVKIAAGIAHVTDDERMLECELFYVAGYEQALRDLAQGGQTNINRFA